MSARQWRAAFALFWMAGIACAQQRPDVPYVRTPDNVVAAMLEMAAVSHEDFLVDLGSGDGRISFAAVNGRGARSTGIDINPALVDDANREAARQGVAGRVNFVNANIFAFDFGTASVITMYLLPHINVALRPRILQMKPGTRVVSHDFDMGSWRPDAEREVEVPDKPYGAPVSRVYLWYVPANVAGRWEWQLGEARVEAVMQQTFQAVAATAATTGGAVTIGGARLQGDALKLALVLEAGNRRETYEFSGRVSGDRVDGSVKTGDGKTGAWSARRTLRGEMRIE